MNVRELWDMGGYELFVWSSYFIVLSGLVYGLISPWIKFKRWKNVYRLKERCQ